MSAYLQRHRGFTLVELLVSTAILAIILLVIFSITQQTGRVWKSSQAKIEAFQGARAAFESITRKLGQATLNGYYDYFDGSGRTPRDPAYDGQPALTVFVKKQQNHGRRTWQPHQTYSSHYHPRQRPQSPGC